MNEKANGDVTSLKQHSFQSLKSPPASKEPISGTLTASYYFSVFRLCPSVCQTECPFSSPTGPVFPAGTAGSPSRPGSMPFLVVRSQSPTLTLAGDLTLPLSLFHTRFFLQLGRSLCGGVC